MRLNDNLKALAKYRLEQADEALAFVTRVKEVLKDKAGNPE